MCKSQASEYDMKSEYPVYQYRTFRNANMYSVYLIIVMNHPVPKNIMLLAATCCSSARKHVYSPWKQTWKIAISPKASFYQSPVALLRLTGHASWISTFKFAFAHGFSSTCLETLLKWFWIVMNNLHPPSSSWNFLWNILFKRSRDVYITFF